MKRIILAFLALLGLVAQAAPISARAGGVDAAQHGAVLGHSDQRQIGVPGQAVLQNAQAQPEREHTADVLLRAGTYRAAQIPAVHIGVDRARE